MSSNLNIPKICEFCKKQFIAKTFRTRFCSLPCNQRGYKAKQRKGKIEKVEEVTNTILTGDLTKIKAMEFLSISQASVLLGISRRTIYRLIHKRCLNIGKFGTRTVLKKSELESFFELPAEVQVIAPAVKEFPGIKNCYTITEIQQRHGISPGALYNMLQRYGIAKYVVGKFTYVAKEEINLIFNAD
ncbi:DNA-binding protein [Flavobacterium album]|uniref:DNA-binding protein n=1 Tax=Flavobacterium album TaxID=2175091 RepID=A0A2S1R0Q0_9FLAO|nr:DNA-binding protein [Flavobacterium album]